MQASEKIWFDGKLVPWDQATVHVAAHVIQYGSSVFEGIRAYSLPAGPAVFCLDAHLERLSNSCKIYRLDMPYDRDTISRAVLETVRTNRHAACYIRPVVFRGLETLAVNGQSCPTHVSIITIEMGTYLGPEALQNGVSAGVSSWQRLAPNTYPAAAKIGGQYINSQFIAMEAARHGYTEGIALDVNGYVSEGSGENLFIVRKGQLFTPPLAASILEGITRACVITLAEEKGIKVNEEQISRETLYLADEIFFCGTAAEITPVRSVDGIVVGEGGRGPITAQLADAFFDIVEGRVPDRHGWLTPVG
jgi:branched-chain amino acid aminotransferase